MGVAIDCVRVGVTFTYLIRDRGALLVDPGGPRAGRAVVRWLRHVIDDPHDVRLIIATHGHFDHVGAAGEVREATGAPLAIHGADAGWVSSGSFQWPDGVTPWGKFFRRYLGPALIPFVRFSPIEPDLIIAGDGLDLGPYGIAGRVVHTPGHSPGSISVVLDGGEAFVGDLAMNGPPMCLKPSFGVFAHQPEIVPQSWRRLLGLGATTIYPAHGRPFPAAALPVDA